MLFGGPHFPRIPEITSCVEQTSINPIAIAMFTYPRVPFEKSREAVLFVAKRVRPCTA
jgi:hypothetical protein